MLENTLLAENVNQYLIYAPQIVERRKAGQFVIIRLDENGERIPLTIADADSESGSLTLVVQEVGKTTAKMAKLKVGFVLKDIVGPLGSPTHIDKFGTVVVVGGGIGIAPAHPIVQALKEAGNRVVSILGARSKDLLIMEEQMRKASSEVRICTDDGSYGTHGLVTDVFKELIESEGKPDLAFAIGPVIMMKFVCKLTKEYDIPTVVSLNPIMVDGTGMCGGCRVTIGGKTKFGCVDGPEFDGHLVDFEELMKRQAFYHEQEKESYDSFKRKCGSCAD
ncbi:MAG: sulfide/dihydroorotate dehydrogenase-like FAD/NAD-binding protein [Deltaproteobacteria bacterium]|nr:sulfide/dihydroorotate dehydrogenase-like FAD/NAD-binding protein [Deltaproteobacteria bacterium]